MGGRSCGDRPQAPEPFSTMASSPTPPGDMWQCLQMLLVVTPGRGECYWWVGARDEGTPRHAHTPIQPQMSMCWRTESLLRAAGWGGTARTGSEQVGSPSLHGSQRPEETAVPKAEVGAVGEGSGQAQLCVKKDLPPGRALL